VTLLLIAGFVLLLAICAAIQLAYGTYRTNRSPTRTQMRNDLRARRGFGRWDDFEKPRDEGDLL
jgi:cytochrome c-type biogenesis protein CcmH/NrfG